MYVPVTGPSHSRGEVHRLADRREEAVDEAVADLVGPGRGTTSSCRIVPRYPVDEHGRAVPGIAGDVVTRSRPRWTNTPATVAVPPLGTFGFRFAGVV